MKLYVGNLPWSVTEESLKKLFSGFEIEESSLIMDKYSGRSKGFGFVTISNDEQAKKAIEQTNGKEVDGRQIKVSEAKPMEERPPRENRGFGRPQQGNRGRFNNNRSRY